MNDDFLFANNDVVEEEEESSFGTWKVIIIDDEPEVHAVTKLALSDFVFQDKSLEFYSAYSGEDGKKLILEHPDAAIVLLDVVMETDDAGLRVAKYIREEAHNHKVRIILRTGQPGQAPERQVILDYDINDYKSKTELTAQKLFTVIMSSLRAYRDIIALDNSRKGLKKIIEASADIFKSHSMDNFINGVMQQLTSVIGCGNEQAMYITDSLMVNFESNQPHKLRIIAAQGDFEESLGKEADDVIDDELRSAFNEAIQNKSIVYRGHYLVAYCYSRFSNNSLLYVSGLPKQVGTTERTLIEMFAQNVQIAYENVQLQIELEDTQRELVYRLTEAVEKRSNETGNHARRVALISRALAKAVGLTQSEAELVESAAPLHDVGKISIPDQVLHKPGKLDEEEWDLMKTHAEIGHKILEGSNRSIIQAGAIIARDHHENWDGTGYPAGKKGDNIHIFGRIVALADVYDALRHDRCYKSAWEPKDTIEFIEKEAGKKFDPSLVKALKDNVNEIEKILLSYPDDLPH
jgi:response regulator RpfG family c-di-GMP phosphodiesterase